MSANITCFKSSSSQQKFESWMNIGGGINPNTADEERFFDFVVEYYKNKEQVDEKTFVKICKYYTHTTRRINRGICQKYYRRLQDFIRFIKWQNKK